MYVLSCRWAALSIILLNVDSWLIGRKFVGSLSPFLCMGVILASFSVLGKLPDSKHLLIIIVSGGAKFSAQSLTSFGGILSKPDDVLLDSDFIICQVWYVFILFSLNLLLSVTLVFGLKCLYGVKWVFGLLRACGVQ